MTVRFRTRSDLVTSKINDSNRANHPANALIFKAARLRALQDTPNAFGSTYAKDQIIDWATLREALTLQLMVTSNNEPAILFYRRLGFGFTKHIAPYPNDPALLEYQMSRSIS